MILRSSQKHIRINSKEKTKPFIYRHSNDDPNVPIIKQNRHPVLTVRSVSYVQKLHLSERNYSAHEIKIDFTDFFEFRVTNDNNFD